MTNALCRPKRPEPEVYRQEILTRALLTYCVNHPDAKDTLEGIRRFWFPAGQMRWSIDEVRKALERLTARQWLTSRTVRRSAVIYGVNKEKLDQIKSFLGASETDPQ